MGVFEHKVCLILLCAVAISPVAPLATEAADEIQVYNADIAKVGQWTIQQHLNYTWIGRTKPDFPGGLRPNHTLNGTPELAYGITDWWEIGFYAPFAITSEGQLLSNGGKIRNLFVSPEAEKRSFFYGVNFEFSYETPPFAQTRYALEVRPILGVRSQEWELIVNPIVDLSFGTGGEVSLAPAARFARKLAENKFIGLEYYADFGPIENFLSPGQQQHYLFIVTDFQLGKLDIELG